MCKIGCSSFLARPYKTLENNNIILHFLIFPVSHSCTYDDSCHFPPCLQPHHGYHPNTSLVELLLREGSVENSVVVDHQHVTKQSDSPLFQGAKG
jgi:hypothetical protein